LEFIPETILVDDFYLSMKVLDKGAHCISDLEAIAHEALPGKLTEEFRRKSRISSGNFQNLKIFGNILISKPIIRAFCFFSHKVLRWISPILILLAFLSSAILTLFHAGLATGILSFLCLIFLIIPMVDYPLDKAGIQVGIIRNISYFAWMNLALLIGFIKYWKGIKTSIWQPTGRK
ncbi:MAG: glycosyl transferase family 2, partial [Saprospiraceae bacterium]